MCLAEKSLEGKLKFFPTILVCANNQALGKTLWHTSKFGFAVCSFQAHGKNTGLPCAKLLVSVSLAGSRHRVAHGKNILCHVPEFCHVLFWPAHGQLCVCRVPEVKPTTNYGHTNSGHTAQFPVVYEHV